MSLMDRVLGKGGGPEEFSHLGILGYRLNIETSAGSFIVHSDTSNFLKKDQRLDQVSFSDVPGNELCKVKCLVNDKHEFNLLIYIKELPLLEERLYRLATKGSYSSNDLAGITDSIVHSRVLEECNTPFFEPKLTAAELTGKAPALTLKPKLAMTVNDDMSYSIQYGNQQYLSPPDNFRLFKYLSKKLPDALINKEDIDLVELSERYINRKF